MKPFQVFISELPSFNELLDIYLELRLHFQELGFSDNDLAKPPTYTEKMMRLFHRYQDAQQYLLKKVNDYGFDMSWSEFLEHMKPLLKNIDDLTPLSNVNYKRDDSGDEDY